MHLQKYKIPGLPGKKVLIFLLLPVLFFSVYLLLSRLQQEPWLLIVRAPALEQAIHTIPIRENDNITLSYTHSVSGRPVSGTFVITDTAKIKPYSTEFDSYGPGLPEPGDPGSHEIKKDLFVIYHKEEPREQIRLFVSPQTEERLVVHGKAYDLTSQLEGPLLLEIYVLAP
ncbi:MAG: DUF1850 domain-containing protein [Bacillota bacterium]